MIPVIAQIDQVAAVRAAAVPLRQAADGARSDVASQAVRNASQTVEARRAVSVPSAPGIRLTVKPDTHEVIATLVNTETNEVIREIPGEETRRAREVIRAIAGQLLDKLA
jgi:uncharacterized FlaG/YvyC family protein